MKRKYPAHFVSKISDSDSENAETSVWLDFSRDCIYISDERHQSLILNNLEVGRLLGDILKDPKKYQ
jgi:four helix bundle protein